MIRTFVFLDLETTGLIKRSLMPKITELSMIAVSRDGICNHNNVLPRVLHKMVLPIHPNCLIPKEVQIITKLSDESMEDVQPFENETFELMTGFMKRLTIPICFVAYNGNKFDYPILLSEVKKINKNFGEDILSIDMLDLIREFFTIRNNEVEQVNIIQNISSTSFTSEELNILLNDDDDKMLCDALDSVMTTATHNPNKSYNGNNTKSTSMSNSMFNTPKTNCYKKIQEINEKTPEGQIIKLPDVNTNFQARNEDSNKTTARRRLDFTSSRPSNFKLTTVAKYILGTEPENAHTAEGDCLTMLRCASQLGNFFSEWADSNAMPLINYEKK